MATPPADWEQLELFIGTEHRFNVLANPGPYNLFGVKGHNARQLKRAWRGDPEDDPDIAVKLQLVSGGLTLVGLFLAVTGAEPGHFWSELLQPTKQQWLGYALLTLGTIWLVFPPRKTREQLAAAERREEAAKQKTCVTVELRLPGRRRGVTLVRRRPGMVPLWAEESLTGRVQLTLEGLSSAEIESVLTAVSDLNPQP